MRSSSPLFRLRFWAFVVACLVYLPACKSNTQDCCLGYIEGDYVYISSPLGGILTSLQVERGRNVEPGTTLFTLDDTVEKASLLEAEKRLAKAQATVTNLTKGKRPTEIAALQSEIKAAQANLALAESTLSRKSLLSKRQVISPEELDAARSSRDAIRSQVNALISHLETAELGAREDEIEAANAEVEALRAAVQKAVWSLNQKTISANEAGVVEDTIYRPGEFVASGAPVVSLLPPPNIKARFFVPETRAAQLQLGSPIEIAVDGLTDPLPAIVSFISPRVEFTPPVIYSNQTRSKLVILFEGRLVSQGDLIKLHPGQPITVTIDSSVGS